MMKLRALRYDDLRGWHARDRRIAELRQRRRLSVAERDELHRLEASAASHWRRLPRMIAARRADLARLTAYADEIGLGPC